jgi:hypothetical protein
MWNVLSRDYDRGVSPKKCLRNTLKGLSGGDIISLHDSAKSFRNTSYLLPQLLRKAREMGYDGANQEYMMETYTYNSENHY